MNNIRIEKGKKRNAKIQGQNIGIDLSGDKMQIAEFLSLVGATGSIGLLPPMKCPAFGAGMFILYFNKKGERI